MKMLLVLLLGLTMVSAIPQDDNSVINTQQESDIDYLLALYLDKEGQKTSSERELNVKRNNLIQALASRYQRTVAKTLTVDNGGGWGDWYPPEFCQEGSYAVGYNMKIEPNQGGEDDTTLNAVSLQCMKKSDPGQYTGNIKSAEGRWGNWVGQTMCPGHIVGQFLTAFNLQVERDQGDFSDDTAANFVKFMCRNFQSDESNAYEMYYGSGHGLWGKYLSWSQQCEPNTAVCGIQVKIEKPQGSDDDTALNDMKLFCCS